MQKTRAPEKNNRNGNKACTRGGDEGVLSLSLHTVVVVVVVLISKQYNNIIIRCARTCGHPRSTGRRQ